MPTRYICDVLDEMRQCYKTMNFGCMRGLIEEAQIMANRMEASLREQKDYNTWVEKTKKEKQEYNNLLQQTNKMRKELGKKEKKMSTYE